MAKAAVICKENADGTPNVGASGVDYSGFVHIGQVPGAYAGKMITGTNAQITAILAHANTLVGVVVTEPTDGTPRWQELNTQISTAARTRINAWRTANGQGNVPVATTWLQVIKFAANHFDGLGNFDVFDAN